MTNQELNNCRLNNIPVFDEEMGKECDILSLEMTEHHGMMARVFYVDTFEEDTIDARVLAPLS